MSAKSARELSACARNVGKTIISESLENLAARVDAVMALKHPLTCSADYDEGWFACIKQVHDLLDGRVHELGEISPSRPRRTTIG